MSAKDKENANNNDTNGNNGVKANGKANKSSKASKKAKNKIGIWLQIKYRLIGIGLGILLFIITAIILELFNRLT